MRCAVCGEPSGSFNSFGGFCSNAHYQVRRGYQQWCSQMMDYLKGNGSSPGERNPDRDDNEQQEGVCMTTGV